MSSDDDAVQKVRAWTGLLVVAVGDVAIVIAAIDRDRARVERAATNTSSIVAILSSGFTAVGTMTTAYFGIRAASNTAQSSMKKPTGCGDQGPMADGVPPGVRGLRLDDRRRRPPGPGRTAPEYRASRAAMIKIVQETQPWFFGGPPYQDHHGGGIWVKDEHRLAAAARTGRHRVVGAVRR